MFKKLIFVSFLIIIGIFSFIPKTIFAASEQISDYQVEARIDKSSRVEITEKIQYDFGTNQKHGIFRKIPFITQNANGKKYKLNITVKDVSYGDNSLQVPYSVYTEADNLIIKIGDPNSTITGVKNYVISYTVDGAINYFSDHDELYWNAIGTGWNVPIQQSKITIDLSNFEEINQNNIRLICYTGVQGSSQQNCSTKLDANKVAHIVSKTQLNPHEGLTFAVAFPKGLVAVNEPQEYVPSKVGLWIAILLFLFNTLPLIGVFVIWWKYGRDPKGNPVVVRMYDVPKDPNKKELSPLELGTLVDETANPRDISAEIIWLAIHKYLIIKEDSKKETILTRGPKLAEDLSMSSLKPHQKEIIEAFDLDKIETTSLSNKTISTSRALKIEKTKANVYQSLTDFGYFKENPVKVRTRFFTIGFIILFLGAVLPGIALLVVAYFMPRKTELGVEIKRHALGLNIFLKSQDRQFEFQEKNFYFFEKLLPYAVSFNVAKIWAKKFEDLTDYHPEWYQSNNLNEFTAYGLARSLENSMKTVEQNFTPTSSSTGHSSGFSGGSSGGGGGGGGGGSW